MMCGDIRKASRPESTHKRLNFVDRIPADPGLKATDRRKALGGIQLERARGVKSGNFVYPPSRTGRLEEHRTGDTKPGVIRELVEQQLDQLGPKVTSASKRKMKS
jgi:hypothetical protein